MVFALAGLVALVLLVLFTNRSMRGCRWRAQASRPGMPKRYKCMSCGAEADTDTGEPPQLCLNPRKPPPS